MRVNYLENRIEMRISFISVYSFFFVRVYKRKVAQNSCGDTKLMSVRKFRVSSTEFV